MSALTKDELIALDSAIDSKIRSLPILTFPKWQTTLDLVRWVDFTIRMRYMPMVDESQRNSATMNLLDGFSFLLEWVLKYCPDKQDFSFFDKDENRIAAIVESVSSAQEYSFIFDHMAQLFRNKVRGVRKGNKILLEYSDMKYSSLDAATRLLSGIDLKRTASNEEIDLSSFSRLQARVIPNIMEPLLGYHYNPSNISAALAIAKHGTKHLWELDGSWDFGGYTLAQFRSVWEAIHAVMHIHLTALMLSGDGNHVWFCINPVKSRGEWMNLLIRISQVDQQQVELIIDDLTFDIALYRKGIPRIDIRYQPFIPIGKEQLILSNFTVMFSNIERNLWHLLSIKRPSIHSTLSTKKEELWRNDLRSFLEGKGIESQPNVSFSQDGKPRDIDLLVLDSKSGFLLAIELKWHIGPDRVREVLDFDKELEKGLTQAQAAKEWLALNKAYLQKAFSIYQIEDVQIESLVLSKNSLGSGILLGGDIPIANQNLLEWVISEPHNRSLKDFWSVAKNLTYLPVKGKHYKDQGDSVSFGGIEFVSKDLGMIEQKKWDPREDIIFQSMNSV